MKLGMPIGSSPPHASASSNVTRPVTFAPRSNASRTIGALASSTWNVSSWLGIESSTSPPSYQAWTSSVEWSTRATKPSSDIDISTTTFVSRALIGTSLRPSNADSAPPSNSSSSVTTAPGSRRRAGLS